MSVDKAIETIEHLRIRPLMYLRKDDFNSLSIFLCGYLTCYSNFNKEINNNAFSIWVSNKNKIQSSLVWPVFIQTFIAKNDDKAYDLTFDLLLEFFNKHKSKLSN